MPRLLHTVNAFTAVGAAVLFVMSIWPGYAGGCVFLIVLPLIASLGLAWLIVVAKSWPRPGEPSKLPALRWVILTPLLVCFTYGSLRLYVPRRIVFRTVQSQFVRHITGAPTSASGGVKFDRWLGPYRVDEYAADPRGGVYFRTGTGRDGIGPDRMSYGFVYQPNRKGSPFGAARYMLRPTGGDGWHWFQASDDWR